MKNPKWLAAPVLVVALIGLALFGDPNGRSTIHVADPPAAPAQRAISRPPAPAVSAGNDAQVVQAFQGRKSGVAVTGAGVVSRLLPDDNDGSRHQKFILDLPSGGTLLIAHYIDIAPRINALRDGDLVEFYGLYEWNDKGGVVHWTHRDPQRRHSGGWLRHGGQIYK